MFPKPIEKSHRAWQIGYQALLPIAMLLWLAPLLAVALFSIRPDSDFLDWQLLGLADHPLR